MNKPNWRPVALSLTVAGACARLLPHPPNFAPVGAVSLFAGARLPTWQAYAIPLAIMALTDPLLNVMRGFPAFNLLQVFTYASFLISVWIGRRLVSTENLWRIGGAVLLSSSQFFLITNIGSWLYDYPHTLSGLGTCYIAAIPFFERTLFGDFFFTAVLFGLHALLTRTIAPSEQVAAAS
jgi:hypothetical protein